MMNNHLNVLFQAIAKRYERGSIVITGLLNFSPWEPMLCRRYGICRSLHDQLLRQRHVLQIQGES